MKHIFTLILALFASSVAFAHGDEEYDDHNVPNNVIVESHELELGKNKKAHVIIRDDGHLAAAPFLIEFRPDCKGQESDWKKLEVETSESFCDYVKGSFKYDAAKKEVVLQVRDADGYRYNEDSLKDPFTTEIQCVEETRLARISVKNLCARPNKK